MKNFILIFIIFLNNIFAQEQNVYVEYIDKQIYRKETSAKLIANKDYAIYSELGSIEKNERKATENPNGGSAVGVILEVKPNKFYKQKDRNIIFYNEYIHKIDTIYYVQDTIPKLNWQIVEGTEKILGYTCHKAKVKFRGSNLIAYFTHEIPIQFGPWKFDGLPGLILKVVSEDDNKIEWLATKIQYPSTQKVIFDIVEENYKLSLKDFKYKSFKITEDNIKNNNPLEAAKRLKFGKRIFVVEKLYEWEKTGDIWRTYYIKYFNRTPLW